MTPEDFIGTELTTKASSVYKIVGVNNFKGSNRKYKIDCSVCSVDIELFPEIWARKGDIVSGKLACGCALNPAWNDDQYEILCKRRAKTLGVSFIGFTDISVTNKTKVIFLDRESKLQENMYVSYFLKRYNPDSYKIFDDQYYSDKFEKLNIFPNGTIFKRVYLDDELTNKLSIFCPICAETSLCKNGITSPWFVASYSNLLKGNRPCLCSANYKYSKEEYEYRLEVELIGFGSFVSISDVFEGNKTSFKWLCNCGALREQRIADFLTGKRCTNCAVYGFKGNFPASLYAVVWGNELSKFIKIGITNNSVQSRINQQKLKTNFKPLDVFEIYFEKGSDARRLENKILSSFTKETLIEKNQFSDGYTELIEYACLDELKRILEQYATHT